MNYRCQVCGYRSISWFGKCPSCLQYSTLILEEEEKEFKEYLKEISYKTEPVRCTDIELTEESSRLRTGFEEFDRVLGGGIVMGSVILIGGNPGTGKSTLLLQVAAKLTKYGTIFYVSSEEAINQLKLRIDRLSLNSTELFLLSQINLEEILEKINKLRPKVAIIDSIQTLYSEVVSSPVGSISQVRAATAKILQTAKSKNISIFIVGHLTKEGIIAGPKLLEHMVDTVLYLEYINYQPYRVLRSTKNRYGSTNEIGIFELKESGFDELSSPSLLFLEARRALAGSVVTSTIEGTRPLLVEVQALVSRSYLTLPRREILGADYRRVMLVLAVCEKILKINLASYDVFVNIVGGLYIKESACDMAILSAIISSYKEMKILQDLVILGEVGLTGEVRGISFINNRLTEAKKLGFKIFGVPSVNKKDIKKEYNYNLIELSSVEDVYKFF